MLAVSIDVGRLCGNVPRRMADRHQNCQHLTIKWHLYHRLPRRISRLRSNERTGNRDNRQKKPYKNFMAGGNIRQRQSRPPCVYCGLNSHRSSDCTKVLDITSRREYLARNKLSYNCARSGHLASKCKGRGCGKCNGRYHTSVCDKMKTTLPPTHKGTPESSGRSDRYYGAMDSQNMCTCMQL